MKYFAIAVIAILLSFSFYSTDRLNKMNADIKFIRLQFEKNQS